MCTCTTSVDPHEVTNAQISREQKTQHQMLEEAKVKMGQPSLDATSVPSDLLPVGRANTSIQEQKSHQLAQLTTWPRESLAKFEGL